MNVNRTLAEAPIEFATLPPTLLLAKMDVEGFNKTYGALQTHASLSMMWGSYHKFAPVPGFNPWLDASPISQSEMTSSSRNDPFEERYLLPKCDHNRSIIPATCCPYPRRQGTEYEKRRRVVGKKSLKGDTGCFSSQLRLLIASLHVGSPFCSFLQNGSFVSL